MVFYLLLLKEHTSGIAQNIELKPSYGLSQIEINNMLENAFKMLKKIIKPGFLTETRIDAECNCRYHKSFK